MTQIPQLKNTDWSHHESFQIPTVFSSGFINLSSSSPRIEDSVMAKKIKAPPAIQASGMGSVHVPVTSLLIQHPVNVPGKGAETHPADEAYEVTWASLKKVLSLTHSSDQLSSIHCSHLQRE